MTDTARTRSQLIAAFPDNTTRLIHPQDDRDFVMSAFPWFGGGDPTVNNDRIDTAGIGAFFDTGSHWYNVSPGTLWYCKDGQPGAAVWDQIGAAPPPTALQPGSIAFASASSQYGTIDTTGWWPASGAAFTIVFWLKTSTPGQTKYIFSHADAGSADVACYLSSNGVHFFLTNGGFGGPEVSAPGFTSTGWHLIGCGWDPVNGVQWVQLDGGPRYQGATTLHWNPAVLVFTIGCINGGGSPSSFLDGQVAQLAFIGRVVSPAEITCMYANGTGNYFAQVSGEIVPSVARWWPMDEPTGPRIDLVAAEQCVPINGPTLADGILGWRDVCTFAPILARLTSGPALATALTSGTLSGNISGSGTVVIDTVSAADIIQVGRGYTLTAVSGFTGTATVVDVDQAAGTITTKNPFSSVGAITFTATPMAYEWIERAADPKTGAAFDMPSGRVGTLTTMPAIERNGVIVDPFGEDVELRFRGIIQGLEVWDFEWSWIPGFQSVNVGDPFQNHVININLDGNHSFPTNIFLGPNTTVYGPGGVPTPILIPSGGSVVVNPAILPPNLDQWVRYDIVFSDFPSAPWHFTLDNLPDGTVITGLVAAITQTWTNSFSGAMTLQFGYSAGQGPVPFNFTKYGSIALDLGGGPQPVDVILQLPYTGFDNQGFNGGGWSFVATLVPAAGSMLTGKATIYARLAHCVYP